MAAGVVVGVGFAIVLIYAGYCMVKSASAVGLESAPRYRVVGAP